MSTPIYLGGKISIDDVNRDLDSLSTLTGRCFVMAKDEFMMDGGYTLTEHFKSSGNRVVMHGKIKEVGLVVKGMMDMVRVIQ